MDVRYLYAKQLFFFVTSAAEILLFLKLAKVRHMLPPCDFYCFLYFSKNIGLGPVPKISVGLNWPYKISYLSIGLAQFRNIGLAWSNLGPQKKDYL